MIRSTKRTGTMFAILTGNKQMSIHNAILASF